MPAEEFVVIQLDMRNARKVQMEARGTAAAVRSIGTAGVRTGLQLQDSAGHGWAFNQMMFTLRRVVYAGTLALGAMSAAAIYSGIQFNSTMEQNDLAFTTFLGSAQAARQEMQFLFDLAAKTPFEFTQLTGATRQLLAFGFTIEEVNPLLKNLSDAMSAMGLSGEAIDRATLALGQIMSSGRLLGQDLRQLEQLGLVNPQDFARRLGINPAEIGNVGQMNIPSKVAIDAIQAYWTEKFHGAATKFSHTLYGQFTTLHDYGTQLFGTMTQPLSDKLEKDILPKMNKITLAMTAGFKSGGMKGMTAALDEQLGTGKRFQDLWGQTNVILDQSQGILTSIGTIIRDTGTLLGGVSPPLIVLGTALTVVNFGMDKLHWLLVVLLGLWTIYKSYVIAAWMATKLMAFWQGVLNARFAVAKAMVIAYMIWLNRSIILEEAWTAVTLIASGAADIFTGSIVAMTVALLTNPITWLVLAAVLLIAGLVILYFKWKKFHDIVNATVQFVKQNWAWVSWLSPLAHSITLVYTLVKRFFDILQRLYNLVRHPLNIKANVTGLGKSLLHLIPGYDAARWGWNKASSILGLAHGGRVTGSGVFTVGERGPESVFLPVGSAVAPTRTLTDAAISEIRKLPIQLEVRIPIFLDGREITEVIARRRQTVEARA